MPELPELEVIKQRLEPLVAGRKIEKLMILKPYVLKNYCSDDLRGEAIERITRRGKYLDFQLTAHEVYVHLMLHGSIAYVLPPSKTRKSAAALLLLADGAIVEFNERASKKRMSIYVKPKGLRPECIENLGVEPLSEEFTIQKLRKLLRGERKQLKSLLCRQSRIAGIGNAYADEILWRAGMSPFKISADLNAQETEKLHGAIIEVLNWAIAQVAHAKRLEKRDFLRVHGKKGHLCPRCGDTIRVVSFTQSDTFYCPGCQTGGRKLKDRRLSKFFR